MKEKKLTIQIDRPVKEVFSFTLNPANTPKWISSVVFEETDEAPTRLGTIYRNQNKSGDWSEYEITAFEENSMFIMSQKSADYHVKYTFKPISNSQTLLEYFEYVDNGKIEQPFTQDVLQKLKEVIEF